MSKPIPVYRLTDTAFRALHNEANNRPHLWEDPQTDFAEVLKENGIITYWEPTGVTASEPISLEPPAGSHSPEADRQALDFHKNLNGMTPAKASDPQLLAWINHFALHGYGIKRWPLRGNNDPTNHIKRHYLTETSSAIYEASIAGRTWWIAETCLKAEQASGGAFTAQQALELFSESAERYHYGMRFSFMRSPLILAEYIRALLNEAKGLNRSGVMSTVRQINREAGAKLVDSLNREQCRLMIVNAAQLAMTEEGNVIDRKFLRGRNLLNVLSLGAGTQSTVMALMSEQGYNGMPKPDLAIFADTGWEPQAVYEHLDWLETQLSYPVVRVSAGNIKEDLLSGKNPRGHKFMDIPAYLAEPDGKESVSKRQCTSDYKLDPIKKELRKRLKLEPGKRAPKSAQVKMWLGISTDEMARAKPSRDEWITNHWPLIDQGYNRAQLYMWFKERYPERELPRSACLGCPYHSDSEWKHLKEHDPKGFAEAVFVDQALRNLPQLKRLSKGEAYLHRSRQPLAEVDFSNTKGYSEAMQDECEGLCGV